MKKQIEEIALNFDFEILNKIKKEFEFFDCIDLISKLAALRLLPHNGDHSIRLDVLLHLVSSITFRTGPKIKRRKLNWIINLEDFKNSQISMAEDPSSQCFCEEITFFGGGYRVFPGAYSSIVFILKNLLKALFLQNEKYLSKYLYNELLSCAMFVLSVSEEIAKRANIKRYTDVIYRDDLFVPPDLELEKLSKSVLFSEKELRTLANNSGSNLENFMWLFSEIGEIDVRKYNFEKGQLLESPILRIGNKYIITDPGSLISSFRRRVLKRIKEENSIKKFSKYFRWAIWDSITRYLDWMGIKPFGLFSDRCHNDIPVTDGVFRFDSDKALIVILLTDSFQNMDEDYEEIDCKKFEEKVIGFADKLLMLKPPPSEIMYLFLNTIYERTLKIKLIEPLSGIKTISLSVDSLEIIAILEGGKDLFFYKYAIAQERIRELTEIICYDNLSEYGFFKKNDYSYYSSDDALPSPLIILGNSSRSTRLEALKKIDIHSVYNPLRDAFDEFVCIHDEDFPLYIPSHIPRSIEVILENLNLPIWFFSQDEDLPGELRKTVYEIIDMVGYWFYEMKDFLNDLIIPLKEHINCLKLFIEVEKSKNWNNPAHIKKTLRINETLKINYLPPDTYKLEFTPEIMGYIYGQTNLGEKEILIHFFESLRDLYRYFKLNLDNLSMDIIQRQIDIYMPLSKKKKLCSYDTSVVPEIDPIGIPDARFIDEIDRNLLLDEIGSYARKNNLRIGATKNEQAHFINKNIVGYLWEKLQDEIKKINRDELILYLVYQNEALTRERIQNEIWLPMRLEIDRPERVKSDFSKHYNKITTSSIACRFLIECATSFHSGGRNHINNASYDKMLALAAEIINWGFLSDFIINKIGDLEIRLLPSGRIGFSEEQFKKAMNRFSNQVYYMQVKKSSRKFDSYWTRKDQKNEVKEDDTFLNEFNEAFKGEFGFTLTDFLHFEKYLLKMAEQMQGKVVNIPQNSLLKLINKRIDQKSVLCLIELFSLCQRDDLFSYPGHKAIKRYEFYPWRYNRQYSYIRRPLLKIQTPKGIELVYGWRHWNVSRSYFFALINNGRLAHQAKTLEFKHILTKLNKQHGEKFNIEVANVFNKYSRFGTYKNVTRFGKKKIEFKKGEPLGDIDVFVIDNKSYKLIVIECKDLLVARTPYELNLEINKVFRDEDSHMQKHIKRTEWVKNNLKSIIKHFGLDETKKWKVKSFFIVNDPLFSSHFKGTDNVKVLTFDEFKEKFRF